MLQWQAWLAFILPLPQVPCCQDGHLKDALCSAASYSVLALSFLYASRASSPRTSSASPLSHLIRVPQSAIGFCHLIRAPPFFACPHNFDLCCSYPGGVGAMAGALNGRSQRRGAYTIERAARSAHDRDGDYADPHTSEESPRIMAQSTIQRGQYTCSLLS